MSSTGDRERASGSDSASPRQRQLPLGFRVRLDPRVRRWADGSVLIGGAPWRVSRISDSTRAFVRRLVAAGNAGVVLTDEREGRIARALLDRGFANPVAVPVEPPSCRIVVPAMDRVSNLDRLLASLHGPDVLVVDDGSRDPGLVASTATRHGAATIVHGVNRGPAAARNTGLGATTGELIAFIDSDCIADLTWVGRLSFHFLDPTVAVVAPRIVPTDGSGSLIERYEAGRSSLDMGRRPELVLPGARLGFVPSAAIVVRRSALGDTAFDEDLRLGEDVDLTWRLVDAGWLVRYEPTVRIQHATHANWRSWVRRHYEYGTSAPRLAARHPGRLTPARVSAWNVAVLSLLAARRPFAATCVAVGAAAALRTPLRGLPRPSALAARTVGQGLIADGAAIGHLLRREWWPVGAVALAAAPRSPAARLVVACMLGPIAWEWIIERPEVDLVRYCLIRQVDDAAYGTGVIASSVRARSLAPLLPHIRMPAPPRRARRRGNAARGDTPPVSA